MEILFVAGIAVISPDPVESRKLYVDALGLPLKSQDGADYYSSEAVAGVKHFGVWPLSEAARACFGTDQRPSERPVPQMSIEFDVASPDHVERAVRELEQRGFTLLHGPRTEPWGQTVARLQSIEGAIVGISYVPWMH